MKLLMLIMLASMLLTPNTHSAAQSHVVYNYPGPTHSQLFIAAGSGEGEKPLLPLTGMDYPPSLYKIGKRIALQVPAWDLRMRELLAIGPNLTAISLLSAPMAPSCASLLAINGKRECRADCGDEITRSARLPRRGLVLVCGIAP